jgi:cellulose synthase/poly-beta-1,6-N-acetylglucosamine synthase-like glycosyltransferase
MYWLPAILILPYVITIIKIYISLLKIKPFTWSSEPKTFVSVVVSCRNEQKNLPVLLNSISLQNYPEYLYEVIIVNDNSTDKTSDIAARFNGIVNLHRLDSTGKGKKQALRAGINTAKGNLIITTDADCRMGNNWIKTIAAFYEKYRPDMIICPVQVESHPGFLGRFQDLEFLSLQGITAGCASSGKATMCNGANLAFTRDIYLDHSDNLHDEINSGDDIFLLQSLKKEPHSKILWLESPEALVTTESQPTLSSFLTQRKRWISKGKVYKDIPTIFLGLSTLFSALLQISYMIACFIESGLIWFFLAILFLKSVPDFLILLNTSGRYGKRQLLRWFLPAQLIYPFYVISVIFYSPLFREK